MKFSFNWLKELSGTEKGPEELAAFLTMRAFEVEEVSRVGFSAERVFVGQVLSAEKHPNADRLRVARVHLGEKGEKSVVCGAPNLEVGQRVAVALPGATLPGGENICETDIRGVRSEGMICSEKELGRGEGHEGIVVLPETAEVGLLLRDFFGSSDWLFDVKILPDRAHDCLSHVGLAREIATLEGRVFDYDYDGLILPKKENHTGSSLSVSLDAEDKSLRYIGALVRKVRVGVSPMWLVDRLGMFGMRSINAVVDATNLIMLELGQPLHAFDWDTISGNETKHIGPRYARSGETITLLDGQVYELNTEDIVIADQDRAVALGGIMGGADTGVTPETTAVLFEAAHFDPVSIRRTRTRLGIESDASSRFEKGLSPDLAERAMVRLLEVVTHLTGGEMVSKVDAQKEINSSPSIECSLSEIVGLLGTEVSEEETTRLLELRGCRVSKKGERFFVVPPRYRLDIVSVADIVEEIGKGIGYDRIPPMAPDFALSATPEDPIRMLEESLRRMFSANGFSETYNYSFYGERDAKRARLDRERHFSLENPLNPDQALVRTSLIPGLLKNVEFNMHRFARICLFELGKGYEIMLDEPKETRLFSGVMLLPGKAEGGDFFQLKSEVSRALASLRVPFVFRPIVADDQSFWHPTRTAEVVGAECSTLGKVGEAHPSVSEAFGISGRVGCFEFDVKALLGVASPEVSFVPIRKYPETLRDISCFVSPRTPVSDVEKCIVSAGGDRVLGIELFDRYVDPREGRSLAFHVRLGKEDGTLTGEEADRCMEDIARDIEHALGAKIRVSGS